MESKIITIVDIAKDCGFSKTTVACALNGNTTHKVAERTRAKIKKSAAKLGYRVNLAARELRSKTSNSVGILLPSPSNYFYAELLSQLDEMFRKNNYSVNYAFWKTWEEACQATNMILSRPLDALITCEPLLIPSDCKIPVINIGDYSPLFDYVNYDSKEIIRIAVDYLQSLGHQRISYLGFRNDKRTEAFAKLIDDRKLFDAAVKCVDAKDERSIIEAGTSLLKHSPRPSALILHSDMVAFGIMRKAWEMDIKVPDDISVMGFDNVSHAAYSIPALTSIGRKFTTRSFSDILLETVRERLEYPDIPLKKITLEAQLVIRESCKKI